MNSLPIEIIEKIISYTDFKSRFTFCKAVCKDKYYLPIASFIQNSDYSIVIVNKAHRLKDYNLTYVSVDDCLLLFDYVRHVNVLFNLDYVDEPVITLIYRYHNKFRTIGFSFNNSIRSCLHHLFTPISNKIVTITNLSGNIYLQNIIPRLPNLRCLHLNQVPHKVDFSVCSSINELVINDCHIKRLPRELSILTLINCHLCLDIPPVKNVSQLSITNAFDCLRFVERTIDNSPNLTKFILHGTLKSLISLTTLKKIIIELASLPKLTEFSINGIHKNDVFKFPTVASPFVNLSTLKLNHGLLINGSLDCFQNYDNLRTLFVNRVFIRKVGHIYFPQNLESIMVDNFLLEIESTEFTFDWNLIHLPPKLKCLKFRNGYFDNIPTNLPKSLQVLDLSLNFINVVPTFFEYDNLEILKLSHNEIEDVCILAPNLIELNLQGNEINNMKLSKSIRKIALYGRFPLQGDFVDINGNGNETTNQLSFAQNITRFIFDLGNIKIRNIDFGNCNLTCLMINCCWLQKLQDIKFPATLSCLEITSEKATMIDNVSFATNSRLKELSINAPSLTFFDMEIPDSTEKLCISLTKAPLALSDIHIPKDIQYLHLESGDNSEVNPVENNGIFSQLLQLQTLCLVSLNFDTTEAHPLMLPKSIVDLTIKKNLTSEIHLQFPPTTTQLSKLTIAHCYSVKQETCQCCRHVHVCRLCQRHSKWTFESIGNKNGTLHSNLRQIVAHPQEKPSQPQQI